MDTKIIRTFCLDHDILEVFFYYDEGTGKYFGEYPDFEEAPRYTKNGWPWVTVMQEACENGINKYLQGEGCMECGSCECFRQEQELDLIGICVNPKRRKE